RRDIADFIQVSRIKPKNPTKPLLRIGARSGHPIDTQNARFLHTSRVTPRRETLCFDKKIEYPNNGGSRGGRTAVVKTERKEGAKDDFNHVCNYCCVLHRASN